MKSAAAMIQRIVKDPMVGNVVALPMMMKGLIVVIVVQVKVRQLKAKLKEEFIRLVSTQH